MCWFQLITAQAVSGVVMPLTGASRRSLARTLELCGAKDEAGGPPGARAAGRRPGPLGLVAHLLDEGEARGPRGGRGRRDADRRRALPEAVRASEAVLRVGHERVDRERDVGAAEPPSAAGAEALDMLK